MSDPLPVGDYEILTSKMFLETQNCHCCHKLLLSWLCAGLHLSVITQPVMTDTTAVISCIAPRSLATVLNSLISAGLLCLCTFTEI